MEKSALITKVVDRIEAILKVDDALFVALVSKSRELLIRKFPKAEFHMIVWDQVPGPRVLNDLRNHGINVHLIRDVLPSWWEPRFRISQIDGHPSALAYQLVSQYVIQHIVRE